MRQLDSASRDDDLLRLGASFWVEAADSRVPAFLERLREADAATYALVRGSFDAFLAVRESVAASLDGAVDPARPLDDAGDPTRTLDNPALTHGVWRPRADGRQIASPRGETTAHFHFGAAGPVAARG